MSPCSFNLYAEYIMRNAGLEEAQARIKIAGRNINNLRYADDTTLMAEREEELKSLLVHKSAVGGWFHREGFSLFYAISTYSTGSQGSIFKMAHSPSWLASWYRLSAVGWELS